MKTITTAVAVLLATMVMTACAKKETAAPVEAAPVVTPAPAEAVPAPAEAAPAATSATPANDEDAGQTSGDKVAPKP